MGMGRGGILFLGSFFSKASHEGARFSYLSVSQNVPAGSGCFQSKCVLQEFVNLNP